MRSQVRREGSRSCSRLLLCSCTAALPTLLLAAQGTTFLDGDDGGDHVSNGGTRSMLVDGERRHDISLLCLGNRPNTKPSAASPACLGFQASYSDDWQAAEARQERGLRRPFPSPACTASVIKGCLPALPACLPASRPSCSLRSPRAARTRA